VAPACSPDYQADDTALAECPFSRRRKSSAGRLDLAGDAYNRFEIRPLPDANPMDCNGHGSHVAGIAAGYGR